MNCYEIDELIRTELERVARDLANTILLEDQDYDESAATLAGVLITLEYYSTRTQYAQFVNSLPEAVLDLFDKPKMEFTKIQDGIQVETAADSELVVNLRDLGFKAYMGMAELGFISIESMIELAKLQLQSNGTKA